MSGRMENLLAFNGKCKSSTCVTYSDCSTLIFWKWWRGGEFIFCFNIYELLVHWNTADFLTKIHHCTKYFKLSFVTIPSKQPWRTCSPLPVPCLTQCRENCTWSRVKMAVQHITQSSQQFARKQPASDPWGGRPAPLSKCADAGGCLRHRLHVLFSELLFFWPPVWVHSQTHPCTLQC